MASALRVQCRHPQSTQLGTALVNVKFVECIGCPWKAVLHGRSWVLGAPVESGTPAQGGGARCPMMAASAPAPPAAAAPAAAVVIAATAPSCSPCPETAAASREAASLRGQRRRRSRHAGGRAARGFGTALRRALPADAGCACGHSLIQVPRRAELGKWCRHRSSARG